ncbi:hypothetical protein GH714_013551 [Hevea brasiliensis]|uniref:DUF6821 domain-containing protein n=1 Tax=Hevea brasiliensis TaxID=3981 RepID=A0A6A6KQX2_HEVBR|nr:hypothetical protein GH714_013551 [Hevea brasiliensis]
MEGEASVEFQDWELLANSDAGLINSPNSANNSRNFDEIEADSEGVLRLDYFSLENNNRYAKTAVDASEEGSVESDNPSWIDPAPETRYQRRNSGELWSDSGSDRSERKFSDFDVKNELYTVEKRENRAVMGFIILGRRLYKTKSKIRSLPLKVTVDDKKVSQFMSRAGRLNEAFSVVRRVPIVRPLLPATGPNSWPVMTLR